MRIFFFISLIFSINCAAQKGHKMPGERIFDFWIGNWDLTWSDTSHGTNHITRILDGKVIHEDFSSPAGRFYGQSWTVYDSLSGTWRQTWVDNQSGYIALTGGLVGERRILNTAPMHTPKGEEQSRMIFYNITGSSFTWDWEKTTDGGKTWKLSWRIYYKRRKNK